MIRPLVWMRAVRDDPRCTGVSRLAVLWALALRMRGDGSGYASVQTLAEDAEVCERTVRYATQWARQNDYLDRTRRGHRLGNGQVVASEWQLILPSESQPAPSCTLSESQPARGESQPANAESQPAPGAPPRGQVTKRSNHQDDTRARDNGAAPWEQSDVQAVVKDSLEKLSGKTLADDDETRRHIEFEAKRLLDGRTVTDPSRYVKGALRKAAEEGRLEDHLPTPIPPRYAVAEHRRHCEKYGLYWPESNGVPCTCNPRYTDSRIPETWR